MSTHSFLHSSTVHESHFGTPLLQHSIMWLLEIADLVIIGSENFNAQLRSNVYTLLSWHRICCPLVTITTTTNNKNNKSQGKR